MKGGRRRNRTPDELRTWASRHVNKKRILWDVHRVALEKGMTIPEVLKAAWAMEVKTWEHVGVDGIFRGYLFEPAAVGRWRPPMTAKRKARIEAAAGKLKVLEDLGL